MRKGRDNRIAIHRNRVAALFSFSAKEIIAAVINKINNAMEMIKKVSSGNNVKIVALFTNIVRNRLRYIHIDKDFDISTYLLKILRSKDY